MGLNLRPGLKKPAFPSEGLGVCREATYKPVATAAPDIRSGLKHQEEESLL